VSGPTALAVLREAQIPLLAALLLAGFAAKARRALGGRQAGAAAEPAALFPLVLRRPAAIGLCAAELAVGGALVVTADGSGAGTPALVARVAAVVLFGMAVVALYELRLHRPGAGCGCFGDLSDTPVSWRVIARAGLLTGAALASIGAPPLAMPGSAPQACLLLGALTAEVAALAVLSPEVGRALLRLGHVDPCELREVPVARTLSVLRGSAPWRRYRGAVGEVPADVWREGCWRFLVFPGVLQGRRVEVVFAVSLAGRRAPVRVGLLDAETYAASPRHSPTEPQLQLSNGLYQKPNIKE
jgi:hypothetical protein